MYISALKRVAYLGLAPRLLIARASLLRLFNQLPKQRNEPPGSIKRIFFSFPYHSVGDLILSLAVLERVHILWPDAQLDAAIGESMAEIVECVPYVNSVLRLPRTPIRQPVLASYAEIQRATLLLRQHIPLLPYDLAIAPRWDSVDSFFAAHLAFLTGAPVRCGYSATSDGGAARTDRFHTHLATGGANEHESLRYARLLARCGLEPIEAVDPDIPRRPLELLQQVVKQRRSMGLASARPSAGPYIVLSPGASSGRRMWPIERFAELGRHLFCQNQWQSVIVGGPADRHICESLSESIGSGALSLAGRTTPLQMLDIISGAKLFFGNDSGPAHMAGSLGIETVVVSPFPLSSKVDHPNSPRRFRPRGPRVTVVQPHSPLVPCFPSCVEEVPHCILQISTADVLASIVDANVASLQTSDSKTLCD
jgi:ADP-heptose:LPS heptosyltransferase